MTNIHHTDLPLSSTLLEKMEKTEQNPMYHAEGNVLIHTQSVLQKYHRHIKEFALTPEQEQILYWVTVLHDIGKVATTKWYEARWISHGHEEESARMAREILLEQTDLSLEMRNTILRLIRWHGFPLSWVIKEMAISDLKPLGTQLDLKLLSVFALLDFWGRISFDQEKVTQKIKEFHEIHVPKVIYELGSHDFLDKKYQNWSVQLKNAAWKSLELKNIKFLESLLLAPEPVPQRRFGKVIFASGASLSGKTTQIKRDLPDTFHINLADFDLIEGKIENKFELDRRIVEFKHLLTVYIRRNKEVVVEGSITGAFIRQALNKVFRDLNLEIEYWLFETPISDLLLRNQARFTPLAEEEIRRSFFSADMPHPWEAHSVKWFESRGNLAEPKEK